MDDKAFDDLISKTLRDAEEPVPAHLMARVLADADRLQPATPPPPARQSLAATVLDALGGWIGPVAIAASLVLGIGIGAGVPAGISTLPGLQSVLASEDDIEALGFGEFDLSTLEW